MAYEINQLLEAMIENGASDLHLHVGRAPSLRVSGSVVSISSTVHGSLRVPLRVRTRATSAGLMKDAELPKLLRI